MLGPRGWDSVVVAHLLVQALKLPLAASVLVDLVPPPKTHEEPPAHVLNLQREAKGKGVRMHSGWVSSGSPRRPSEGVGTLTVQKSAASKSDTTTKLMTKFSENHSHSMYVSKAAVCRVARAFATAP